jgi:hypothetical protein
MANTANPRGFTPVQPIVRMREYVKTSNGTIYPGDALALRPDGKVYVAATSGTTFIGVAAAYATATQAKVLVYDDPTQQFYIQDDGVGGTLAQADIGAGFDVVVTAGNATFLKSAQALDTSTKNTATAARAVVLLGFHPSDEVGKYVRCRVRWNFAKVPGTRGSTFE